MNSLVDAQLPRRMTAWLTAAGATPCIRWICRMGIGRSRADQR